MNNQIKYAMFTLINLVFVLSGYSQTAAPSNVSSDFNISINATLCAIAVVLLFIIIMLTRTVYQAIDFYKYNNTKPDSADKGNVKPLVILTGLFILSHAAYSQNATAATTAVSNSAEQLTNIYFYSFITVIIIEIAIVFFLLKALRFLTGLDKQQSLKIVDKPESSFWNKINQLKPLEEEKDLDTGHSYDGIRELDNVIPPWFTAAFVATIIFAIIYLYRYEVAKSVPDQFEEYQTEMRDAKVLQDSILKLEGNNIDENSVVMLSGSDLDAGRSVYTANCAACHGDKGQGGVGPNLTDDFWVHSGSIKDVFKSIKYGWVEKGMKPWKDDFSPKQIAQLSSFVKSLKGTNPPNAKEKQGELYVEKMETSATDTTAKATAVK
jgi:cytochrome c oxidase cbb3-type subunit 3